MDGGCGEGVQGGAVSSVGPKLLLLPHLLTVINGLVPFRAISKLLSWSFFPHNMWCFQCFWLLTMVWQFSQLSFGAKTITCFLSSKVFHPVQHKGPEVIHRCPLSWLRSASVQNICSEEGVHPLYCVFLSLPPPDLQMMMICFLPFQSFCLLFFDLPVKMLFRSSSNKHPCLGFTQLCLILCDPQTVACQAPLSTEATILECVAISYSNPCLTPILFFPCE